MHWSSPVFWWIGPIRNSGGQRWLMTNLYSITHIALSLVQYWLLGWYWICRGSADNQPGACTLSSVYICEGPPAETHLQTNDHININNVIYGNNWDLFEAVSIRRYVLCMYPEAGDQKWHLNSTMLHFPPAAAAGWGWHIMWHSWVKGFNTQSQQMSSSQCHGLSDDLDPFRYGPAWMMNDGDDRWNGRIAVNVFDGWCGECAITWHGLWSYIILVGNKFDGLICIKTSHIKQDSRVAIVSGSVGMQLATHTASG